MAGVADRRGTGTFKPGRCLEGRRILLVGSARQCLVACRDLGRAGAIVEIAKRADERDLASASRWAVALHALPDPQGDPEAFASALTELVATGGHEVVFPTADEYLPAVSAIRERIPALVPLAPHASIVTALDKLALGEVAERSNLRAPLTSDATDEVIEAWPDAAIVKDRSHSNPGGGSASHRAAIFAPDRDAIAAGVASIRSEGGRPVLQQVLEGRMLCFGAFRSPAGTVSGRIQQTSDHLWPVPLGTTARATTTPLDPLLAGAVERLLDDLAWIGPVNLQLFYDDHEYTLIDFNGRFNHSMALAVASGVHAPAAWAFSALTGTDVSLPDARPGVRLSLLGPDIKRALAERRGGRIRDLVDTVVFAATARHTIPSWRDPGPAVQYLTRGLARSRLSRPA